MTEPSTSHATTLVSTELVEVIDWRCAGHDISRSTEWTEAYEICVPRRGAFIREVEGVREFADTTTYAFFSPAEEFRVTHPAPGGDDCTVFRLPVAAAHQILSRVAPRALDRQVARFPLTSAPESTESHLQQWLALRSARTAYKHGPAARLQAEELALRFVDVAIHQLECLTSERMRAGRRPSRETGRASLAREYAYRVRRFVAVHYAAPLTLASIAAAVGCSPFHLHRMFRLGAGTTIHRHLLRIRLRAALERVLETKLPLASVAADCGFASQSHLGDSFRSEFGVPPGALRLTGGPRVRAALQLLRSRLG